MKPIRRFLVAALFTTACGGGEEPGPVGAAGGADGRIGSGGSGGSGGAGGSGGQADAAAPGDTPFVNQPDVVLTDRGVSRDLPPDPDDGVERDARVFPRDGSALTDVLMGPDRPLEPIIEDVRFNEVDCHGEEWIELFSLQDGPLDLSGFRITDSELDEPPEGHVFTFPEGTILAGHGFFTLEELDGDAGQAVPVGDMALPPPPVGFDFGISCNGEMLRLLRPDGTTADRVETGEREQPNTWGRLPDGTGAWQHTEPSKGRQNRDGVDPGRLLFDPLQGGVPTITLAIEPMGVDALTQTPRATVPAEFTIQLPGQDFPSDPVVVGVKIKGRIGSFRPFSGKAGFKIDVNEYDSGQRVFGQKELTLNNNVQDRAAMSQYTTYRLARAMGICAPRVGYAWLRVNGEDYGLYTHVENYDDLVFSRCFETTGHVYEGRYGEDLRQDLLNRYEVKEGDPLHREDMAAILAALDMPPEEGLVRSELGQQLFDWNAITAEFALENYIGHWDGYAPTRNNWVMHVTGSGQLSLQPWGADQCFGRNLDLYSGQGRLFQVCMEDPACRGLYEDKIGQLLAVQDELNLEPELRAIYDVIRPFVAEDPKSPYREPTVASALDSLIDFMANRRREIGMRLECLIGENADPDNDGFRCEADCAPNDPEVNPGAVDSCRDGIDQDCSGVADDDPGCPDCDERIRDGHRYLICVTPRDWQVSGQHCAFFGSSLAQIDHSGEAAWVYEQIRQVQVQDYWTGLNDRDFEGNFTFPQGFLENDEDLPWAAGQPNNAGDEDCVYMAAQTGLFDDLNCLRQKAVVCEDACFDARDSDGDGQKKCSADCDDTDRNTYWGAAEICGDGVDQDCDDRIDEGENCDCFQAFNGAHGYRVCGTPRTQLEARNLCLATGSDLAIFDTAGEAAWVQSQVALVGSPDAWIGLEDRFSIDEFNWVDGNPPTFTAWADREPNSGGADDCVVARGADGRWDDQGCGEVYGVVCEDTCRQRVDLDRDNHPACGSDCNDNDPNVHPGASERCDRVDQDCDGRVDEACR